MIQILTYHLMRLNDLVENLENLFVIIIIKSCINILRSFLAKNLEDFQLSSDLLGIYNGNNLHFADLPIMTEFFFIWYSTVPIR